MEEKFFPTTETHKHDRHPLRPQRTGDFEDVLYGRSESQLKITFTTRPHFAGLVKIKVKL